MPNAGRRTLLSALVLLTLAIARTDAQQLVLPDDEFRHHWIGSASIGITSPFGSDDFATEWNGREAVMATVEYYAHRDVAFGLFGTYAMFDHSGETAQGPAPCMLGVTREQYGGGLLTRIHAARWSGTSLTIGGTVGALNVTRERPVLLADGSVLMIVPLPSTIDLEFGGTLGIETTLAPGTSVAVEAGVEGVDNMVRLNEMVVARASIRVAL